MDGHWAITTMMCPECKKANFTLARGKTYHQTKKEPEDIDLILLVYPKASFRDPCPPEVPAEFADDYREACLVLSDSPKASAALSRRCLQHLLREVEKVKVSDLSKEIDELLNRKTLPSHLAEAVDGVRNVGNFAAHPIKSQSTGQILDVEPGEAEWNLDTLEGLFDFYFVAPAIAQKKRDALNAKLQAAGKPIMKQPKP